MTLPSFAYRRAADTDDALDALALGSVTLLAGGQSLLPKLKSGAGTVDTVLDIGGLAELSYVVERDGVLAIGAATTHHLLATSELLARQAPLLHAAAGEIADPQVRHRGTIGGSLVNADPAADLAVAALAADAEVLLRSRTGERVVGVGTAPRPDELLVEVRVPVAEGLRWNYQKFHRDALEWAVVGVAALARPDAPRIALSGMGPAVLRAHAVERALADGASAETAAEFADDGTAPVGDPHASAEFRRHLARVLVRRALTEIGVGT